MKITIISIIILFFIAFNSKAGKPIPSNEMPENTISYVQTNFQEHSMLTAEVDRSIYRKPLEVKFNNEADYGFGSMGYINSMEGTTQPTSSVPPSISSYVNTHYPEYYVTDWKKNIFRQKVELNNGFELVFNKKGKLFRFTVNLL